VQKGKLREDLYYRLNVFSFRLPPLRERKEDLPLLGAGVHQRVQHPQPENIQGRRTVGDADARTPRLAGNVRELRNVIERATILSPGPFIELKHLPPTLSDEPPHRTAAGGAGARHHGRRGRAAVDHDDAAAHPRQQDRAAEILGISLKTLHNKLNKLRLRPKRD
jgi:DNA-binding NtrC family response regulator